MELTGEYQFGSMMGRKEEERRSTSSLVVENATEVVAVGKDVRLVREIGTARIDKVDARQA